MLKLVQDGTLSAEVVINRPGGVDQRKLMGEFLAHLSANGYTITTDAQHLQATAYYRLTRQDLGAPNAVIYTQRGNVLPWGDDDSLTLAWGTYVTFVAGEDRLFIRQLRVSLDGKGPVSIQEIGKIEVRRNMPEHELQKLCGELEIGVWSYLLALDFVESRTRTTA